MFSAQKLKEMTHTEVSLTVCMIKISHVACNVSMHVEKLQSSHWLHNCRQCSGQTPAPHRWQYFDVFLSDDLGHSWQRSRFPREPQEVGPGRLNPSSPRQSRAPFWSALGFCSRLVCCARTNSFASSARNSRRLCETRVDQSCFCCTQITKAASRGYVLPLLNAYAPLIFITLPHTKITDWRYNVKTGRR